jgi:hypothetical protein
MVFSRMPLHLPSHLRRSVIIPWEKSKLMRWSYCLLALPPTNSNFEPTVSHSPHYMNTTPVDITKTSKHFDFRHQAITRRRAAKSRGRRDISDAYFENVKWHVTLDLVNTEKKISLNKSVRGTIQTRRQCEGLPFRHPFMITNELDMWKIVGLRQKLRTWKRRETLAV